jgi:hypothetical protein
MTVPCTLVAGLAGQGFRHHRHGGLRFAVLFHRRLLSLGLEGQGRLVEIPDDAGSDDDADDQADEDAEEGAAAGFAIAAQRLTALPSPACGRGAGGEGLGGRIIEFPFTSFPAR